MCFLSFEPDDGGRARSRVGPAVKVELRAPAERQAGHAEAAAPARPPPPARPRAPPQQQPRQRPASQQPGRPPRIAHGPDPARHLAAPCSLHVRPVVASLQALINPLKEAPIHRLPLSFKGDAFCLAPLPDTHSQGFTKCHPIQLFLMDGE